LRGMNGVWLTILNPLQIFLPENVNILRSICLYFSDLNQILMKTV
jgi:hypothetical protein